MDKVGEQLPAISTTVAGLVLVFLGLIFTAWDGYEPTLRAPVRAKFRRRAWTAFFAFLCAVLSATLGLIGLGTNHKCPWPDYVGVIFLGLSIFLMMAVAFLALLEI
jgi:hypothetical protein